MTIDINGDVIESITIDGEFTEEVTVDGDVVFQRTSIPDSVVYDFETGDMSRWDNAPYMSAQSSDVYSGSYSGFSNHSNDNYSVQTTVYDREQQITQFDIALRESSNGNGYSWVFYDANHNEVFRLGSSNRDVTIVGASSSTMLNLTGDLNWYTATVTFDWGAGTFTGSSGGNSDTLDLINSTGIKSVELWPATDPASTLGGGNIIYAWFDDIEFTT